jgi:hypothetical protein
MSKSQYRLIAIILPLALGGLIAFVPGTRAQKKKQQTASDNYVYTPPSLQLSATPAVLTACAGETARVTLDARATFSSGTPRYRWSASGGRIEGDGATASWDLSGLQPGYYKAFVDVDCSPTVECSAFTSTTVLLKCAPPVCPSILISCPDRITPNQPITFSANVAGGFPNITPVYNWTVTAGKIISGEGTSAITVDTTGLAGQSVRASLAMSGYSSLNCGATCSVQIPPELPVCRKFDEFAAIARNDEKARLDNYAIELQGDPAATAYVVVYPGQRGKPGEVQLHTTRVVDYLTNSRGVDKGRIVTIIGPTRSDLMVDLWVCPQGAKTPVSGGGR